MRSTREQRATGKAAVPQPAEELRGVLLRGRYRLERVIRSGARAVVYQANDRQLRRRVAVKLVWSASASVAQRLQQEVRVHSALHHPAIPELLDVIDEAELHALVMEHVDGTDLDDLLEQLGRPMGLSRLRVLAAPVISALGYLHGRGIIHRDVKPANIVVYEHRLRERAKLIDFGVALERGRLPVEARIAPELVTGTLLYMSPEHFNAPESVDERSDIYSLGVTLFQMVTGTLPFYARSATAVRYAQTLEAPPSPRALNPDVEPGLEELILTALEKDPARRFQSADALRGALERLRDRPEGRWKRWRRRLAVSRPPRPRRWLDATTQVP